MPELPEVETVARGLREVLPGRRVLSVRLGKTDFIDDPAALEQDLPGSTFARIRRLGKYLLLDLEPRKTPAEQTSLLIHLGMTGNLSVCPPETPVPLHTHVFLALDDGRELRYNDVRRFGRMALLANGAHERVLGGLGLEPLEITAAEFRTRIQARKSRIKAVLLNQTVARESSSGKNRHAVERRRVAPPASRPAAHFARSDPSAWLFHFGLCGSGWRARRVSAKTSRLSTRRQEMFSLRHDHPPHHRCRPQQPFLPAMPARATETKKASQACEATQPQTHRACPRQSRALKSRIKINQNCTH